MHQFNNAVWGFGEYWYDLILASQVYWIAPALFAVAWYFNRKSMRLKSDRRIPWVWILVSIAVLVRVYFIATLPGMTPEYFKGEGGGLNWFYFLQTLQDHLPAHLWNNTVKPPFLGIFYGIWMQVFSMEAVLRYNLLLIPLGALGVLATLAVYSTLVTLYSTRALAFLIALLFSFKQLQLEAMPIPIRNPDVLTVALVALWIWGIVRWVVVDDRWSRVLCAFLSALLVSQQPFHFVVVPITLLSIGFLKYGKTHFIRTAGILAAPILVAALICVKNFEVGHFFAPSNLGGLSQGNLLFAWTLGGEDRPKAFQRIVSENEVPPWYRWCAQRIISPKDENGQPKIWEGFAMPGGICSVELTVDDPNAQCWPFDPRPLHAHLVKEGFTQEAQVVARDIQNTCDGRRLLAGPYPTLSLGWFGYYGKVSSRIIFRESLRKPYTMLQGMFNTHRDYSITGPGFLGREKLRIHFPGSKQLYWWVTYLYEHLLTITYILILLCPLALLPSLRKWAGSRWSRSGWLFYWGGVISIFFHAVIVCHMTAWDLDRYSSHISPVLLVLSPIWILGLLKLTVKKPV